MRGFGLGLATRILVASPLMLVSGCGGGGGGGPVADVTGRVYFASTGSPPDPAADVRIDGSSAVKTLADGSFVIRGVPAAAKRLQVMATGAAALDQPLPTLTAGSLNDLGEVFLAASGDTYTADLKATVRRADTMELLNGAKVRISGHRLVTGADGSVSITGLPVGLGTAGTPVGMVTFTGLEDKVVILDLPLGPGVNDIGDILVSPPVGGVPGGPRNISGKVSLQGASDHSGTAVRLLRKADGVELGWMATGADGVFGFWVISGNYTIKAEHAGYQTQSVDIVLPSPDKPQVVNLTLIP
jgi:hypothetical protein